jgi:YVTN family beta-propeller protein
MMLAVTASVSNAELVVSLSSTSDAAILRVVDDAYVVTTPFGAVGSFASGSFNSIRVVGDAARPNQSFMIRPGSIVGRPLTVNAGVEATVLASPIDAIGAVNIGSSSITIAANVTTSGAQTYSGSVRVAADVTLDAGTSPIVFTSTIRSTAGVISTLLPDSVGFYRTAINSTDTTLFATDPNTNSFFRVGIAAGSLTAFNVGMASTDIVLSADGGIVYLANPYNNRVTIANASTGAVVTRVVLNGRPEGMALSPDGRYLYVANFTAGSVNVIDTVTRTLTQTIPVAAGLTSVAVSPNGTRLWASSESTDSVYAVNLSLATVVATVPVGRGPTRISLAPDGSRLYVANNYDDSLSVVDTAAASAIATIPVGAGPRDVAATPDGRRVFVVNGQSDTVSVIDTASRTVISTSPVGNLPFGITVSADSQFAYAANLNGISRLANGPRSLTVRTTGTARFDAPASTVDPLSSLVVIANRLLETEGSVTLTHDPSGNLRANGVLITSNGAPFHYQTNAANGWTAVAAEAVNGVNTLVLRNSSGFLHYWRMNSSWAMVSTDGWEVPGSAAYNATEVTFRSDFDGNSVIGQLTTVESSGAVALSYDGLGRMRANSTFVMFNGTNVNYQSMVSSGWTPVAAEAQNGINTVVLRHSSGNLHFWRMDSSWVQVAADGWVAPNSPGFFATELAFDADLNGDGVITIEAAGGVTLSYATNGNMRANGTPITFNNAPLNFRSILTGGWRAMAAEVEGGVNTVVLRHSSGFIHFWRMDETWKQTAGEGWLTPGTTDFFTAEVMFGVDLDGDGVLTIEASGSAVFDYDPNGNIRANGTLVKFNGGTMNYFGMVSAGWTPMAADVDNGVNTIVLLHNSGFLHFWRLDSSWTQTGGDGWTPVGSRDFFAAEAAFGADLNGDGVRTIEAHGSFVLTFDRDGSLRVRQVTAGVVAASGTYVRFNGIPYNYLGGLAAGWRVMAADVHEAKNTLLLKHSSAYLHFWRMDATWNQVSGDGWTAPGTPQYLATEVAFGVDIDGNNSIGA